MAGKEGAKEESKALKRIKRFILQNPGMNLVGKKDEYDELTKALTFEELIEFTNWLREEPKERRRRELN